MDETRDRIIAAWLAGRQAGPGTEEDAEAFRRYLELMEYDKAEVREICEAYRKGANGEELDVA